MARIPIHSLGPCRTPSRCVQDMTMAIKDERMVNDKAILQDLSITLQAKRPINDPFMQYPGMTVISSIEEMKVWWGRWFCVCC